MTEKQAHDLRNAVIDMRKAQKRYFKYRHRNDLTTARYHERFVDDILRNIARKEEQYTLFTEEPQQPQISLPEE